MREKDKRFEFALSSKQHKLLHKMAKSQGISAGEWLRHHIELTAKRRKLWPK